MKISWLIFALATIFFSQNSLAQNVGIGTSTPVQKLHVEGATYLNGNVGIGHAAPVFPLSFNGNLGDKISLWTDGTSTHYGFGIQGSLLQMFSKTSLDNIAFGYGSSTAFTERMRITNSGADGMALNGRLHLLNGTNPVDPAYSAGIWLYKADNSTSLAFMGTQNNQNIGFYGGPANGGWGFTYDALNSRVGIGTSTPTSPLNVNGQMTIDQKNFGGYGGLLLKGNIPGSNYPNIAFTIKNNAATPNDVVAAMIQGDLVNNNAGGETIDLTFLTSATGLGGLSEKLRIKGNGNVGIGNADPAYQLDVNNRMRIRSGGNNTVSAGLWLNDNANNLASFIGMEDDTHAGIFGIGAGWKFGMNTQTGALKINGSEGQPRQVLSSNGTSAAGFTTMGNILNTYMKTASTTGIPALNDLTDYPLTQLNHTITLTQKSRLIISANVAYTLGFCLNCTEAGGWLILRVNGSQVTIQNYGVTVSDAVSIANFMIDLNPGTHTIEFISHYAGGSPHTIYPKYSSIIVLPVD